MKQEQPEPLTNVREIARQCGVSPATVSRVLNGKANPNLGTTKLVCDSLKRNGYVHPRHQVATQNILLLMSYPDMEHSEHALSLQAALQQEASCHDARIFPLCIPDGNPDKAEELARALSPVGMITIGPVQTLGGTIDALPRVALTQHQWMNPDIPAVENDDLGGFVQIFHHLRKLGHSRIALFVDDALTPESGQPQRLMLPGLYAAAGLQYDAELLWQEHFLYNQHEPVIRRAIAAWWALAEPPTAIVLTGDCYAPSFYRELSARGLSIPQDVSVTGYADNSFGRLLSPTLTTSRKNFQELAANALDLLRRRIANPLGPRELRIVAPELVVRGSSGPVPAAVRASGKRS